MFRWRWGLCIFLVLGIFAPAIKAADRTGSCPISLQLRNGVPLVRLMVNGKGPFTFIVDTGTSREAIIAPELVKLLDLPRLSQTWLVDLAGKNRVVVDEVEVDTIALPGHEFHGVHALVHQSLTTMDPYDGVLGFALFRHASLTLDFPQRCMRIGEGDLAAGGDANVLRFSMPRQVPAVPVSIGGQQVLAQIDSGGGGINLPESAASAVEFLKSTEVLVQARSQVSTFFLHGGVMKGELALGGQVFKQPFVEISAGIPVGNLGAASLQDFAVTFDPQRGLVRFQSRHSTHRLEPTQLTRRNHAKRPGSRATAMASGD